MQVLMGPKEIKEYADNIQQGDDSLSSEFYFISSGDNDAIVLQAQTVEQAVEAFREKVGEDVDLVKVISEQQEFDASEFNVEEKSDSQESTKLQQEAIISGVSISEILSL